MSSMTSSKNTTMNQPPVAKNIIFEGSKRAFDLVAGSTLLVISSPMFLWAAYKIRRSSPGPVFFRQERMGRNNKPFYIYKFRTMKMDAHKSGPQITSGDDDRITAIGMKLRKAKLDEFPQLINVIRGEMSLVGPRPQVRRFVEKFPDHQRDTILSVRPGITGPTQLAYRHEEAMLEGRPDPEAFYIHKLLPDKCQKDVDYVVSRSLTSDVKVLTKTGYLVFRSVYLRLRKKEEKVEVTLPRLAMVEDRTEKALN